MIYWRDIQNLQIFQTFRLKKNSKMLVTAKSGVTSSITTDEIANALDASTRIVTLLAASTMTAAANGNGKINNLSLLAGFDTTLPAATGTGDIYRFNVGIVNTSNDYGVLANGTDTITGLIMTVDTDSTDNVVGFAADGTDDKIEINGTTKGGLTIGDWFEFTDVASALWHVRGQLTGSGTIITPFAAT